MHWRKIGRIFSGEGQFAWMKSHASQPFAEHVGGDIFRVYFTTRNELNQSHVAWLEIDITNPTSIRCLSETPLLTPGPPGCFDDVGTMMSCVVSHAGSRHLYYTGWSLRTTVPYHWAIGMASGAASEERPHVSKLPGPIVERGLDDPLFCASPSVLIEDGLWKMWYISGVGWPELSGKFTPSYNIRYAESQDGVKWKRNGLVSVELDADELGFSRPSVLKDKGQYVMWYSVRSRSSSYHLEYARSVDGITWGRHSDAGLPRSADGWDCEMIAYPHAFYHGADLYILYCGNGYGQTGFGLAVLDQEQ